MRRKELEIQMGQMVLQELEKDHRQRVAAAKLDEAELMNNRSLFSHHSSEQNLLMIGDQIEVRDLFRIGYIRFQQVIQ